MVTQYGALPLMWADSIAVLLAAAVLAGVGQYAVRHGKTEPVPRRAREVLRAHPMVGDGIVMAAVVWFCWFGFALGLAILGVETGQPGQLVAAGMTGYGVGSLAGSVAAPFVVTRLPRVPLMVAGWLMLGGMYLILPSVHGSLLALAVVAALGGFMVPLSMAALNALITEHTTGSDRRTAFAAQAIAGQGGASLGMLSGGGVIALLGAETTMQVGGVVVISVSLLLLARVASRRRAVNRPVSQLADQAAGRDTIGIISR